MVSLEGSCVSRTGTLQPPHWSGRDIPREGEGQCEGAVRGGGRDHVHDSDSGNVTLYQCPASTYHSHVSCMCVHYRTCVSVPSLTSCNEWYHRLRTYGGMGEDGRGDLCFKVSEAVTATCEWADRAVRHLVM